nr:hypothetical protein CFP56_07607 [Quercus suber]
MRGHGTTSFAKVAFTLLLVPFLVNATSSVCYDGSGNQNTSMIPCDSTASPSGCCPFQYACLSNGLCQSPFGGLTTYSNFGCTEPGGNTGTCSVGVISCNDNSYVCYNSGDCTDTDLIFTLPVGTVVTTIPPRSEIQTSSTSSSPVTSSSALTTSSDSSTSATSAVTSTLPTSTASTTTASTVSTTASTVSTTASTVSTTTDSTPSPSSSSQSNNGVAIGVGVGVAVGIGLIVATALGFWCHRRQKKSELGQVYQIDQPQHVQYNDMKMPPVYQSQQYTAAPYAMPAEMDASRQLSELDSTRM